MTKTKHYWSKCSLKLTYTASTNAALLNYVLDYPNILT